MDPRLALDALHPLIELTARAESGAVAAEAALDALAAGLGVTRAWVQHQDPDGICRIVRARGLPEGLVTPGQDGLPRERDGGRVYHYPASGAAGGSLLESLRAHDVGAATVVAMIWRGTRLGALVLLSADERAPDEAAQRTAIAIASLAGIVFGRARVIAARHRLEQELLQAQRLESIGRVAGGIAHDFNNMLTAMIGYLDLVAAGLPENAEEQGYVSQALVAADQAAVLTRQMLTFARRQPGPASPQDLSTVLARMAPLVRRLLPEAVEVNVDASTTGCWVHADPGQVEQAILNFAFRARDAMPAGGVLTFAVRMIDAADGTKAAALEATDTGQVLDPEALRAAVEPFRGPAAESGAAALAMTIVAALVRDSGGRLEAESDPANGTRLRALWPLTVAPGAVSAGTATARGGNETVLLVEDDPAVLGLARALLVRLGYTVVSADHGERALAALEAGRADLLVADLVMPGMSGRELAARAQAMRPGLRVLLTSGYAESPDVSEVAGGVPFLAKPYTSELLARRMRETLDAPARAAGASSSG
jgi:two-component system cell cycle sensor histidine kinase/response regulator CckA